MKRYEVEIPEYFVDEYIEPKMIESPDGDFVKYEDVEKLMQNLLKQFQCAGDCECCISNLTKLLENKEALKKIGVSCG